MKCCVSLVPWLAFAAQLSALDLVSVEWNHVIEAQSMVPGSCAVEPEGNTPFFELTLIDQAECRGILESLRKLDRDELGQIRFQVPGRVSPRTFVENELALKNEEGNRILDARTRFEIDGKHIVYNARWESHLGGVSQLADFSISDELVFDIDVDPSRLDRAPRSLLTLRSGDDEPWLSGSLTLVDLATEEEVLHLDIARDLGQVEAPFGDRDGHRFKLLIEWEADVERIRSSPYVRGFRLSFSHNVPTVPEPDGDVLWFFAIAIVMSWLRSTR